MTALFMDTPGQSPVGRNSMTNISVSSRVSNSNNNDNGDLLENTIKLKLKKPKTWNWELTTSKSSPNIAFPKILLYNEKGHLLAEANEADCVLKGRNSSGSSVDVSDVHSSSNSNARDRSLSTGSVLSGKYKKKRRSSTTNLNQVNESLGNLVDQLKTQGIPYKLSTSTPQGYLQSTSEPGMEGCNERKLKRHGSIKSKNSQLEEDSVSVDLHTNEVNEISTNDSSNKLEKLADNLEQKPDTATGPPEISVSRKNSENRLQRNLYAKQFDHKKSLSTSNLNSKEFGSRKDLNVNDLKKMEKSPNKEVRFDLQKSKSAADVLVRERKKFRRSNSTSIPSKFSGSILERQSAFKKNSSSSDSISEGSQSDTQTNNPRYFLRTSKAGTLVVCEESFRNRKIRRRHRSITRISETEENELNRSHDKIIQKFVYPGNSTNSPNNNNNGEGEKIQKDDNSVEKPDRLVPKVPLERLNISDNSAPDNDKTLKGSAVVAAPGVVDNKDNNSSRQFLSVTKDTSNFHREHSAASDFKVKRRRKIKEIRRCVSAGTVCLSSSEDEEDMEINRSVVPVAAGGKDSKSRTRRKANLRAAKGDQILALKNNFPTIKPIGSSANIIDETSDEILLRFVRRLESFKQQNSLQQDFQQPSVTGKTELKIDENRNYHYRGSAENISPKSETFPDINNKHRARSSNRSEDAVNCNEDDTHRTSNKFAGLSNDRLEKGCCIERSCQDHKDTHDYLTESKKTKNDNFNGENESVLRRTTTRNGDEIGSDCDKENFLVDKENMGSNVSRNTSKGLSGRRTQSSGNLYTDKNGEPYQTTKSNRYEKQNSVPANESYIVKYNTMDRRDVPDYQTEAYPENLMPHHDHQQIQLTQSGVTRQDRNKFCGSLPNHLDNDDSNVEKDMAPNYNQAENTIRTMDRMEYVTPGSNRPQHKQIHQQSPYNSVSEKETASTSSESSTFKINQDKPDIQLKLPLTRSNFDPSCDQGYGSERSPEDEMPPHLPNMSSSPYPMHHTHIMDMALENGNPYAYNFITKDCTFSVQINKGPRGLGLSISGGIDSNAPFPGLIRIKRLFPHQAAWSTGKLQPGDIILEANGVPLTGLTNYEALEVLRTMPSEVILFVCRPNDEQYKKLSPPAEPPKPPQRTQQQSTQTMPEVYFLDPVPPIETNFNGEFEIIMVKQQGSLGFTLRKEDESVLGHYVRALVREPATTDGRIKPGDKIVAVNDVPLSPMTHEQAVIFLRQASDTVKLRLYRDEAQTPVAAMSPTTENKTICGSGKKTYLRPEAINLLSDLAYKKQNTPGDSTASSVVSSNTSPRRLKRGNKQNSGNTSQSEQDVTDSKSSSNTTQYLVGSQTTSVCSDSEQSIASQCSFIIQPADASDTDTLNTPDTDRPNRPSFLNLSSQSGDSTPTSNRKPKLQFSVPTNAYELNNLDNDALDAPRYSKENDLERPLENQLPENNEFTSLPCETFLIACKTESDLKDEENFSYKNPMYQSAHVQVTLNDVIQQNSAKRDGNKSLLKWKGVVFSPDEEEKVTPGNDSSCAATDGTNPTPATERDFDLREFSSNPEGYKIISVELNRGWNSRLGFSLQPDPNTQKTVIRAIYSDSVAARDGRLRVGDQLIMVNEESVENMPTQQVIELLRMLRGSIAITVLRRDTSKDTT